MTRFLPGLILALLPLAGAIAADADTPTFKITIQNHTFDPAETTIPANVKVKLVIENKDATAEEFESHELNREKVVAGNSSITVFVGPLKPGRYPFFGEFHAATAQGALVVK